MKNLTKKIVDLSSCEYPTKIIQFGEGNFMRGFFDWQIHKMNQKNFFKGNVTVIQPISTGLKEMLQTQDNLYTTILEGVHCGKTVQSFEVIPVINQIINPYDDYEEYLELALDDNIEIIVSNTTEAGIVYDKTDQLTDVPPNSFPAKLTVLLYKRYQLGKKGFIIIPCELIDRNGDKLREIVFQLATDWNLDPTFKTWLEEENIFCCSLVDRIVPGYPRQQEKKYWNKLGYQDSLMVKAEPFMLWVIEGPKSIEEKLPLGQANLPVVITDDMTPYRERKVHLLNGPHTAMVPLGLLAGIETVKEVMDHSILHQYIDGLMREEIKKIIDLPNDELDSYINSIQERFCNPFVHHELNSIALNSISKFKARLLPVILRYENSYKTLPKRAVLALASLIYLYQGDIVVIQENIELKKYFKDVWETPNRVAEDVLSNEAIWGQDLTLVPGLTSMVESYLKRLDEQENILQIAQSLEEI